MKLFLIDNTRKMKKIKKELEEEIVVDCKENLKFKMTKNDYVLLSDEVGSIEGLEKLKNIIILVTNKDKKYIWNLINNYKTIDIIDNSQDDLYISSRIKKIIGSVE